jgi:hypothetical protein
MYDVYVRYIMITFRKGRFDPVSNHHAVKACRGSEDNNPHNLDLRISWRSHLTSPVLLPLVKHQRYPLDRRLSEL